jgi:hypothetical protein
MNSPKRLAGLAGFLYLLLAIFTGYAGGFVEPKMYVAGDAAATAGNLVANAAVVLYGTVATLVGATAWVLLALTLHALLRDVGKNAARALLVFTALGAGIMMFNSVLLFEGMRVATGAVDLTALGAAGSNAIVLLLLDAQHYGVSVAAIFMGLWLIPMGYLAYRSSGMLPKWLGVSLVVGGVGYLVNVLATFLFPGFAGAIHSFILMPATIAEVATIVYLFVMGVRTPKSGQRVLAGS